MTMWMLKIMQTPFKNQWTLVTMKKKIVTDTRINACSDQSYVVASQKTLKRQQES